MSKTQSERIDALEVALAAALCDITELKSNSVALAQRLVEAHGRIDHASTVFNKLRAATVQALTPKREPQRLPRAEFDRALEDLRADAEEAGSTQRYFPTTAIVERAANLRRLEADTRAAA